MSYKLNPNLVPFLKPAEGGALTARLVSADKKNAVLELTEGVQVTAPLKDLDVNLGGAAAATLEFDSNGVLVKFTPDAVKASAPSGTRGGSSKRRDVPQF